MKKSSVFGVLVAFLFLVLEMGFVSAACDDICTEASKCMDCSSCERKVRNEPAKTYCADDDKRYLVGPYDIYACPSIEDYEYACRTNCQGSTYLSDNCQPGDENYHEPSVSCGDGICNGAETCSSCTNDCGMCTCDSQRDTRCSSIDSYRCGIWNFNGCTGTTNCTLSLSNNSCPNGTYCNSSTFGTCIALPNCTLSNCQLGQCGNWSYPGTCLGSVNCSTQIGTTFPPSSNGCVLGGSCNSSTFGICIYSDYRCFKNSSYSAWYNGTQIENIGNCSKHSSSLFPSCCPEGKTCNFTSGQCINGAAILDCSDYHSSAACSADDMNVARNSVNNSATCGRSSQTSVSCLDITRCTCYWNGNACFGNKTILRNCDGGIVVSHGECLGTGSDILNALCEDVNKPITAIFRYVYHNGTIFDSRFEAECVNIEKTYPCQSLEKLGFFSSFSFIISGFAIALAYFFFSLKNKKNA